MAVSQNGWPASPALPLAPISAGGVRVTVAPACAPLLEHVMGRFHTSVEPLVDGWCWGFAYRDIRAASTLSNHSSGTAIDLNAPRHPLGAAGTFTTSQQAAIRRILAECGGLVRWGGDYPNRKDEMHFEVVGSAAQVAAWRPPTTAANQPQAGDGDMTPEQATQLAEVHWMLGQVKPQTDRLPAMHSAVDLTQWGVNDPTSGARALTALVLANQGAAAVDGAALAAAIVAALDDDLAARVADVIAARLGNG